LLAAWIADVRNKKMLSFCPVRRVESHANFNKIFMSTSRLNSRRLVDYRNSRFRQLYCLVMRCLVSDNKLFDWKLIGCIEIWERRYKDSLSGELVTSWPTCTGQILALIMYRPVLLMKKGAWVFIHVVSSSLLPSNVALNSHFAILYLYTIAHTCTYLFPNHPHAEELNCSNLVIFHFCYITVVKGKLIVAHNGIY